MCDRKRRGTAPGTHVIEPKSTDRLPLPEAPALRRVCAQLFVNRGTFELGVNASGAGASSDVMPADRDLEIRQVRATLRGTGLWVGDLGVSVSGDSAWCGMRRVADTIVWSAAAGDPLYADRGSRIRFVAYRNSDKDRDAVSGDDVIFGCRVDRVPQGITRPDSNTPRLPETRLTPREPVEMTPLRRPAVKPRG